MEYLKKKLTKKKKCSLNLDDADLYSTEDNNAKAKEEGNKKGAKKEKIVLKEDKSYKEPDHDSITFKDSDDSPTLRRYHEASYRRRNENNSDDLSGDKKRR